jgi:hypothetical protein
MFAASINPDRRASNGRRREMQDGACAVTAAIA